MYLTDYHIHSACSFDAKNTMTEMAAAAYARGITEVCFTDHCDFDIPETMQVGPEHFEIPADQARQFEEAQKNAPKDMTLRLGLELGEANHDPDRAVKVYGVDGYDCIIGSLHNLLGMEDFFYLDYASMEYCNELYDLYLDELIDFAAIPCFDVMGHIGFCLRYMSKQGFNAEITLARNGDKIDSLLRTLIQNGRGLELNCADLVPGGRKNALLLTFPSVPILRRYRELGGEIVTVGSDAHITRAAGVGIAEGYELLRETGFKYVTTFCRHNPQFIKL
ncbi:MAG: PHP domain-containing protein [Clostridia bacterium]|nr:PHP domain-containing protein [Clostridia bacterium]